MTEPSPLGARAAGVLMHMTSLPAPGGIGAPAFRFIDWLADAGFGWWQTLPVGPPGEAFSPYAARSLFAGGLHLVDLAPLARRGWLDASLVPPAARGPLRLSEVRRTEGLTLLAAERFLERAPKRDRARFEAFRARHRGWLDDWALYDALARAEGTRDWTRWEAGVRRRRVPALAHARRSLVDLIEPRAAAQWFFHEQWGALRRACRRAGVRLLGDTPFYPSLFSADVWANQGLFDLDAHGRPRAVAGVPPDYFSRSGQVWDAPLYRWGAHERDGFGWWRARVARSLELFDAVRLDHFIGFDRAWALSPRARTAKRGAWRGAPGEAALRAIARGPARGRLVAEDLGLLTERAQRLRDGFGLPGMRVLQFGFDGEPGNPHAPHAVGAGCVVYTGTHDNDTARGWAESLAKTDAGRRTLRRACAYLGATPRGLPGALVRAALASPARTAIVPVQDLIGLGSDARMNRPGAERGVWRWRLGSVRPLQRLAAALREQLTLYERAAPVRR